MRSGFVAGDAGLLKQFLLYRTNHGSAKILAVQKSSKAARNDEQHERDGDHVDGEGDDEQQGAHGEDGVVRRRSGRNVAGRGAAIAQLIASASADDVVVLAGKGHEDYQDVMGVKSPFSDLVHARLALASRTAQGTTA